MVNALLEYHFDPESDEDYIEDNKYSDEDIDWENYTIKQARSLLIEREDWAKINKLLK